MSAYPADAGRNVFAGSAGMILINSNVRVGNVEGPALAVVDADGATPKVLALGRNGAWSKDGNHIVFDAVDKQFPNAKGFFPSGIATIDATGKNLRHLQPSCGNTCVQDGNPSWTSDGRIIFECRPLGASRADTCLMNEDGSGRRQLIPDASGARWAPDGRFIAWVGDAGSGAAIEEANTDGSGAHVILTDATEPRWSPDGRTLMFQSPEATGVAYSMVSLANADGSNPRQVPLVAGAMGEVGVFAPDGRTLIEDAFPDGHHDEYRVDPASLALTKVPLDEYQLVGSDWQPCVKDVTATCTTAGVLHTFDAGTQLSFVRLRGSIIHRRLKVSGALGPASAKLPATVMVTGRGLPRAGWLLRVRSASFSGSRRLSAGGARQLLAHPLLKLRAGSGANAASGEICLRSRCQFG